MIISVGKLFLLLFLEIISFIVSHVLLISDLYLAKVNARNGCLTARVHIFYIILYVLFNKTFDKIAIPSNKF